MKNDNDDINLGISDSESSGNHKAVSNKKKHIRNISSKNEISDNQYSISTDEEKKQKDMDDIDNTKKGCCKFHDDTTEEERLGSHPALPTLLKQSVGPLCSQIVNSMYLIINSFWVSHSPIGEDGLTATGAVSLIETSNNAFGLYLLSCTAARISYLFGQKREDECAQLFVDLIRISWIFSVTLPIIMLNICKRLTKWFGAEEKIQEMGFQYLIPVSGLTIIYETYQICCGFVQSMGLSWIYGVCQVCSLILNMAVLDPLFLLGIKTPIWGASLASIISSFIPMTVLLILIFKGKFSIKPTFKMFTNKFSPEIRSALKIGLSILVEILSGSLPDVLLQKFLGNAANSIGEYNEAIGAWTVLLRAYSFVLAIDYGLCQGFLPAASYAFGTENLKRIRNLAFHAIWVGTIWNVICEIILESAGRSVARIWLKEKKSLDIAEEYLRNAFICIFLCQFKFISINVLQATKKVAISVVQSICTLLLPIPLFSIILYFTNKHDPGRLLYSFSLYDALSFIICMIIAFFISRFLFLKDPNSMRDHYFSKDKDINDEDIEKDYEPKYLSDDESSIESKNTINEL